MATAYICKHTHIQTYLHANIMTLVVVEGVSTTGVFYAYTPKHISIHTESHIKSKCFVERNRHGNCHINRPRPVTFIMRNGFARGMKVEGKEKGPDLGHIINRDKYGNLWEMKVL